MRGEKLYWAEMCVFKNCPIVSDNRLMAWSKIKHTTTGYLCERVGIYLRGNAATISCVKSNKSQTRKSA